MLVAVAALIAVCFANYAVAQGELTLPPGTTIEGFEGPLPSPDLSYQPPPAPWSPFHVPPEFGHPELQGIDIAAAGITPVPEPKPAALLALGTGVMALLLRQRKSKLSSLR